MKDKEEDYDSASTGTDQRVWDCGSPLYDSYELASLSHLLDRHMRVFLPATSSSSSSDHDKMLTKSTSAAEASKGKGRRLWKEKVAAQRRMVKFGHAVHAMWFAVANYRSKRVVPK